MLNKIKSVVNSYRRDLSGLRSATTVHELRTWFENTVGTPIGFGFNGDVIRTRIVSDLFNTVGCTVFIETGTYRAATTILAKRLLNCRIFSCELSLKSWFLANIRCLPYSQLTIFHADSRSFLRRMGKRLRPEEIPFIYLDAHWYSDLPLQEELDYVAATWPKSVVLVDDFKVPYNQNFKFDRYGDKELCVERFSIDQKSAIDGVATYFPCYVPELETGARCGYVVFVCGSQQARNLAGGEFPLNLLRRFA